MTTKILDNNSVLKDKDKTCVLLLGPTAVGKTSVAIQLAQHYQTQIISADSRQCFQEMSIGVAKPSPQQLDSVQHYFINSHSIRETVNAALFEKYALKAVEEIFTRHDMAIIVGGTGLYVKVFCEGMDEMPPVDPEIRELINSKFKESGIKWLQQQVKEKDPLYYASGEIQNPHRLIRALEIKLSSGQSIREFQQGRMNKRNFRTLKIGLRLPKEELHYNIDQRVDNMMKQGLLEEVKALGPYKKWNVLQTVGYQELFDFQERKISLPEAIEQIKKNTRHYAKRQMTWFNKDKEIKWFHPEDIHGIIDYLSAVINY